MLILYVSCLLASEEALKKEGNQLFSWHIFSKGQQGKEEEKNGVNDKAKVFIPLDQIWEKNVVHFVPAYLNRDAIACLITKDTAQKSII